MGASITIEVFPEKLRHEAMFMLVLSEPTGGARFDNKTDGGEDEHLGKGGQGGKVAAHEGS